MTIMRWVVFCGAGLWLLGLAVGCAGTPSVLRDAEVTGWVDGERLLGAEFPSFRARYDTVEVNRDITGMIAAMRPEVDLLVFFGSWCGDSWREVPRLIKIVQLAGLSETRVRYYGLDRTKKSSDGLTDTYRIERVPTIIVLRKGEELGRVVELPRSTLEGDLFEILVADLKRAGQPG
jgi:thiol-disulfide isomerase/thioredoxin